VLAAILVLAAFWPTSSARAQSEYAHILVLYSTRPDAQLSIVGERELPRILFAGLAENIAYHSEFIDDSTFPESAHEALSEFLRRKYEGTTFDLVIAIQDGAIEFVDRHRDSLFRDTPVVFLTNDPAAGRLSNSAGLIHERNYAATVAFLRQLQPTVRQVFIVTGAGSADKASENAVRRQLQGIEPELTITYLSGLTVRELEDRLSRLPEHSAVYYVLVTEDGSGEQIHPLKYVDRIAAVANAPTYCWVDSTIDHGIVGGSLYRQQDSIERIGQLALRVLNGEPADSIPVGVLNLNANEVDWRQLQRWRIDEARVPPGTLVRFRDPTVWDRYRVYILSALALLVTQTVLITGLLIQRTRRRRVEAALRGNQVALRMSYQRNRDLGVRLLKAQETERARIARELHDDICQRMLLLTIELESIGGVNPDEPAAEALNIARDIATSLHELSHQLHPTRLRLFGLSLALDRLCLELSRTGIAITYTHDNVPSSLAPDLMLCFFRVVQEALQNAIKHSSAKEVSVHLSGAPEGLSVTIVDNGMGFDVSIAGRDGVGLASIAERVEAIGGSLEIRSNPGAGTRITAFVPSSVVHRTDVVGDSATPAQSAPQLRADEREST
jgi:signal transduction histidine kinase